VVVEGATRVDMRAVKARKDAVVEDSRRSLASWFGSMENLTLIHGQGTFVDAHTIAVGERRLTAKHVFLNTGARPLVPDLPGLRDIPFLTNTEMMDVDTVLPHLVILGGSYIALEFAQMHRRFGARVTVLERGPRLISRDDDDVSEVVRTTLVGEGVDVRLGARAQRVERTADGVRVHLDDGVVEGSHLLVAVGRVPNSDGLGLDAAGVAVDAHGYVQVDDALHTSQPHVLALGDVNGRGAFTHTSYNDFEIAAANLLDGGSRRVSDRIPIYGLYVDPPLGRVGMTEREARATGKRILVGKRPMTKVGRAHERGETIGFIKILVDADRERILGAAILGVEGDEAVHVIASNMYAKVSYKVLQQAVHAHPTVSELIPTVLGDLRPLA
jgi:pyruvate/2-oxoglutarate dehydrogenase complex dihydrolipoamide dehydrogenase (E3) component